MTENDGYGLNLYHSVLLDLTSGCWLWPVFFYRKYIDSSGDTGILFQKTGQGTVFFLQLALINC
jgi:hypothetical protein